MLIGNRIFVLGSVRNLQHGPEFREPRHRRIRALETKAGRADRNEAMRIVKFIGGFAGICLSAVTLFAQATGLPTARLFARGSTPSSRR